VKAHGIWPLGHLGHAFQINIHFGCLLSKRCLTDCLASQSLMRLDSPLLVACKVLEVCAGAIWNSLQLLQLSGVTIRLADAFEIVGHDRDAIPECLGVWECADLYLDE
jgi:hypothetical protein